MLRLGGHRNNSEILFAKVDEDDLKLVSQYNWTINKTSSKHTHYAYTKTNGKRIHLHRLIMGLGPFETDRRIVNHIDGNGLNNTKANLQVCDFMINNQSFNTRKNVGCVYRDMKRLTNCWCATIKMFGTRHRKRFPTEEEARAFIHNLVKDHVKPPRPEARPSQAEPVQVSTLQEIRDLLQIINQKVSSLSQA